MTNKHKKGSFSDILGILIVVLILILTIYYITMWLGYGMNENQNILSNYGITIIDRDISLATNVFEKTALFFGLQKTAVHLGEHGGVPIDIITEKENIEPKLNFYNDVYSWTFIQDCDMETRIPFTTYKDKNIALGDYNISLKNPNNVELKTVILNIWMFKDDTVSVTCAPKQTCKITGDSIKISKTGTYIYNITNTNKIILKANSGVALLKLVGASPYIGTANRKIFIDSMNQKLTDIMQESQKKSNLPKSITASDITAIFGRDAEYITGFSKFKTGIVGEIKNPELPNVTLQSFGDVEEKVQARYWKLYDLAQNFTLTIPDVLNYRLWNVLETFDDQQTEWVTYTTCGGPLTMDNSCSNARILKPTINDSGCPSDFIQIYTPDDFYDAIKKDIEEYSLLLDTQPPYSDDKNITIHLEFPKNTFNGCMLSDKKIAEKCNSENFEIYEYVDSSTHNIVRCTPPSYNPPCGPRDHIVNSCCTENQCTSYWYHRYILKKPRIKVTLTDEKYKTIDENGNWNPLKFIFMIELGKIDDNCCDGFLCDGTYDANHQKNQPCDTTNTNGNPFKKPEY